MDPLAILGELVPHDGREWRLDALGAIVQSVGRRTPMVELSLSPRSSLAGAANDVRSNTSFDSDQSIRGSAAVSDFSFFRMGSIWIDGIPNVDFPPYDRRRLALQISEREAAIYPAHHQVGGHFLIPPFAYYNPFRDSAMVAIKVVDSALTVLFPCSEIFRFYYCGPSGTLGTAILDGTFWSDRWKFVNDKASWGPDKNGVVVLRRGAYAYDQDVIELARFTFSPYARAMARKVTECMFGHGAKGLLVARFPFEGPTKLDVRGVQFRGVLGPTFLAFVIERCTAPLPFTELIFERNLESNKSVQGGTDLDRRQAIPISLSTPLRTSAYTQQRDPSAGVRAQFARGFLALERYAIKPKVTYRPRTEADADLSITHSSDDGVVRDTLSSGTQTSGEPALPIKYKEAREKHRAVPLLDDFYEAIEALQQKHPEVPIEWFGTRPFRSQLASETKPSKRRIWPFVDGRAKQQLRQAAIATAALNCKLHVLIEIERNTSTTGQAEYFQTVVFTRSVRPPVSDSEFEELLDYLVGRRGQVSKQTISIGKNATSVSGLRHDDDPKNPQARALIIFEALKLL